MIYDQLIYDQTILEVSILPDRTLRAYAVGSRFSVRDVPDRLRFQTDGTYRVGNVWDGEFHPRHKPKPEPRHGKLCPGCGITLPLIGRCASCWD